MFGWGFLGVLILVYFIVHILASFCIIYLTFSYLDDKNNKEVKDSKHILRD